MISVADHQIAGRVTQPSPFCPDIAATPDGRQVWLTLKDVGKAMVFDARPPFQILKTLETGPLTNHVNFARNSKGSFAYVTVGALNEVQVYRTDDFSLVTRIPVGNLPHGLWPSGDGSRIYVGLENQDALAAIDTVQNKVIANVPIGQAPQAIAYVPGAVPQGTGTEGLQALGVAGSVVHMTLGSRAEPKAGALSGVSLYEQGLLQVLQVSVVGLEARQSYVLALARNRDGTGNLEPLSSFDTNPAGAAIVNAVGPIRQIVHGDSESERRYLVIARGRPAEHGTVVQIEVDEPTRH